MMRQKLENTEENKIKTFNLQLRAPLQFHCLSHLSQSSDLPSDTKEACEA